MTEQIGEIFIRKGKYVTYQNINLKIPYSGQVSLQYCILYLTCVPNFH